MTVDRMIEELKKLQDAGFGVDEVYFKESDGYYAGVDFVDVVVDKTNFGRNMILLSV